MNPGGKLVAQCCFHFLFKAEDLDKRSKLDKKVQVRMSYDVCDAQRHMAMYQYDDQQSID